MHVGGFWQVMQSLAHRTLLGPDDIHFTLSEI
jgi:hypothetical protein